MHSILYLITTTVMLIFTSNAFAFDLPTKCLPSSIVAGTNFTKAWRPTNTPELGFWAMASDDVEYEGNKWTIGFVVLLPRANESKEALKQGQDFFKKNASFNEFKMNVGKNLIHCTYGYIPGSYLIEAQSPSLHL